MVGLKNLFHSFLQTLRRVDLNSELEDEMHDISDWKHFLADFHCYFLYFFIQNVKCKSAVNKI